MGYRSEPSPSPLRHLRAPAVAAGVPLPVAAGVMRRHGVVSLVVLDGGRVCGVLTEADLLRSATLDAGRLVGALDVADVCCRNVAALMTPNPMVLGMGTPLVDAAASMMAAGRASALTVDGDGDGTGRRAVNGTAIGIVTGRDIAAAAEQDLLDRLTIEDVSVAVEPLALDDAVERAVELGARAGGRPVPVVDDAAPVGTVQIPFSPLAQAGPAVVGPDVPVLPPAPAVVSRPQGRRRFYLRRSVRQA